jgi:chlorobactene glucosyltransferase
VFLLTTHLLEYLLWLLAFSWLVSIAMTVYGLARRRVLAPAPENQLSIAEGPLVSIIVPARNEADRVLTDSIRSILNQDYGRFEVIAIDDRSTDATGKILKSLAQTDSRLRVIKGAELPAGWLGKPHAIHQALQQARGEWVLATDADMIFDPKALRTALAQAISKNADAISLIPFFEAASFWERVMIPAWAWVMLIFTIVFRIDNPKSPGALGIGGFFLLRRAVLDRVGGYEALRNEVMEDVRLAEMIKRSGSNLRTEYAPALLRTRMYRNFREMWESGTKTWFSGMKFSLLFAVASALWMYLMTIVPPVLAVTALIGSATGVAPGLGRLIIPAALAWLGQITVLMMAGSRSGVSPVYALTAPLGLGLLYTMLLDSGIRIKTGKGVTWKGRLIYERAGVAPPNLRAH